MVTHKFDFRLNGKNNISEIIIVGNKNARLSQPIIS